ncbi:MAG TPA: galactofuranose ABC transporter, permease protein YjfF [Candidatus Binatia bacterium]|nr:galactofuranose ABC transporter, permease protein YjfF [Candidatus Binatia bacterium]
MAATVFVFLGLYGFAAWKYEGFFTLRVFVNLLGDNSFLAIAAVGMTFVILSGGIDLSVGSVLAFTTIFIATLVGKHGVHPAAAIAMALGLGTLMGTGMGWLIHRYELPPFLVTLGGMFFARGMAFVVNQESVLIEHPFSTSVQEFAIRLTARAALPATVLVFLVVFVLGVFVAHHTRFGRNVYAIGGSESSARLMGLPVARTKVTVYALSGFCSALAGVVWTFYTGSGNPTAGIAFELDAIACVVIGGTLLSGGVGTLIGTLFGLLIYGTLKSTLDFASLNSWWLRIAIGGQLAVFILLQRFLSRTSPVLRPI